MKQANMTKAHIARTCYPKNQRGSALVEVMLATLVLTVGSIAFLRLQQIALQSSFNDYARRQATSISQGFVDLLRSNPQYMNLSDANKNNSIIGGKSKSTVSLPQSNGNCKSSNPGKVCALATLNYHRYLIDLQMKDALAAKQSLLCYRENTNQSGYIRITFMWLDSTNNYSATNKLEIKAANCPATFGAQLDSKYLNNSVTTYAQL